MHPFSDTNVLSLSLSLSLHPPLSLSLFLSLSLSLSSDLYKSYPWSGYSITGSPRTDKTVRHDLQRYHHVRSCCFSVRYSISTTKLYLFLQKNTYVYKQTERSWMERLEVSCFQPEFCICSVRLSSLSLFIF